MLQWILLEGRAGRTYYITEGGGKSENLGELMLIYIYTRSFEGTDFAKLPGRKWKCQPQANLFHKKDSINVWIVRKELSMRHPLPTFDSFIFFQAPFWLGVDKLLQKLTKSYKSELRHLFQFFILIFRKCPCKTPFQHSWGGRGMFASSSAALVIWCRNKWKLLGDHNIAR